MPEPTRRYIVRWALSHVHQRWRFPFWLRRKLEYWENVQGHARDLLAAGQSAESIRDQVLGPESTMTAVTREHFSKQNLIKSLVKG